MKKNILIYVYNNLSQDELVFWEQLYSELLKKGYDLYFLLSQVPKEKISIKYSHFIERLDNVMFPNDIQKKYKKCNFQGFLEREKMWYGTSDKDRLSAAKFQKYKYKTLLKELNPSLLILGNGQHAGDLILKEEAFQLDVPVIYIERGSLPKSWHVDKYGMTAGTEIAKETFNSLNLKDDISKYLIYKEFYLKSKFTWWDQPEKTIKNSIRDRFNIGNEKKIILFANQLDNDTSNFLYNPFFNNNLDAFSWFCKKIKEGKYNCFILVKKHPYYTRNGDQFNKILEDNNIAGKWVDDIPLDDCILQSDLVCAVNSTLLFEALIYEKPVLQLGDSLLNKKEIVYKIKTKEDSLTVKEWFSQINFNTKLSNFEKFMAYLVNSELSFFIREASELGLNYVDFFIKRILPYAKPRKGGSPNKFLKLNNVTIEESLSIRLKQKSKRYIKRIYSVFKS